MGSLPQIIRSPKGDELVVLPKGDYDRLVRAARRGGEDAGDALLARAVMRRLAAGTEELVPARVANRLLDGEHPVCVWREHRGLTAAALARRVGLSRAYVTQIETGARAGSARTLRALARALGVGIEDLLPAAA